MTEELTAEERAELLREWGMYPPDFDVEQKLLRCYDQEREHAAAVVAMNATCIRERDAALARAEAADRLIEQQGIAAAIRIVSAESRLAAAEDLLRRCARDLFTGHVMLHSDIENYFLPDAPAPAAPCP